MQQHFIDRCEAQSAALYLFLVTVSDAQGLSYYATLTSALLDRLLDHVETVVIEGKSYRGQSHAEI